MPMVNGIVLRTSLPTAGSPRPAASGEPLLAPSDALMHVVALDARLKRERELGEIP